MRFIQKWLNPDLNPNPDLDLPTIGVRAYRACSVELRYGAIWKSEVGHQGYLPLEVDRPAQKKNR